MTLVSSHRMYDVNPGVADLWSELYAYVVQHSGVNVVPLNYPAPAPLSALWARDNLGMVQMCGWPFHRAAPQPQAIAAPVLADPQTGGAPVYWSDMVVRADAPFATLDDTFGGRVAWTDVGSHSGFNAPRRLLLDAFQIKGAPLYARSLGPLITPRAMIRAVTEGSADLAPLDAHFHLLLQRHEPDTAAQLRVIARTPLAPVPLLVAAPGVPSDTVAALRAALVSAHESDIAGPILRALCIARYVPVDPASYAIGDQWHQAALAAGYDRPM